MLVFSVKQNIKISYLNFCNIYSNYYIQLKSSLFVNFNVDFYIKMIIIIQILYYIVTK